MCNQENRSCIGYFGLSGFSGYFLTLSQVQSEWLIPSFVAIAQGEILSWEWKKISWETKHDFLSVKLYLSTIALKNKQMWTLLCLTQWIEH